VSQPDPRTSLIFLAGAACVGAIFIFFVLPAVMKVTSFLEAVIVLSDAIGSYFNNRAAGALACVVILISVAGCCVISLLIAFAFTTCFTSEPSSICRLIGR